MSVVFISTKGFFCRESPKAFSNPKFEINPKNTEPTNKAIRQFKRDNDVKFMASNYIKLNIHIYKITI
jgi:hypothetical protein